MNISSDKDTITARLMAPDGPFAVTEKTVNGRNLRVFAHAPQNLGQIFDTARVHGAAEFIVHNDVRLSFNDFFVKADALSGWLVTQAGIKPGQSVALAMRNSAEWMISFVAIVQAGGVAVLLNSRNDANSMLAAIEDSDSGFIIADTKRLAAMRGAGCELTALCAGEVDASESHTTAFTDALGDGYDFEKPTPAAEDLATMFFTSGTTGRAKAAALTHRNMVTGVMNTQMAMTAILHNMAEAYDTTVETIREHMPRMCSLLVFPLFHISGCSSVFLASLTAGGKLVLMDRWDAATALSLVEAEKITSLGGVPTMHWDILQTENIDKYDLSSLSAISNGGQALPPNLLARIRAQFPNAFIGAGYGMTETSGAVSQANGEAYVKAPKSSGQILPMLDVKIIDPQGNELPAGEAGEIQVRGATVMKEYYNQPEITAKTIVDGWMKTGDIGYLADDGYLYVVDRKTDMVISGGENIYCAEVEQTLAQHPDIKEVITFGVPDDRLGEKLIASLSLTKDLSIDELEAFARSNLADYKVPKSFIINDEFEHNAMGKIEKHKVRAAYLAAEQEGN